MRAVQGTPTHQREAEHSLAAALSWYRRDAVLGCIALAASALAAAALAAAAIAATANAATAIAMKCLISRATRRVGGARRYV